MEKLLNKLPKLMADPEFAKAYDDATAEFNLAREIIKARVTAGLSQEELAKNGYHPKRGGLA